MNRINIILIVLLASQAILILVLGLSPRGAGTRRLKSVALYPGFKQGAVKEVTIADREGKKVRMRRQGKKWTLASRDDYPIRSASANKLLTAPSKLMNARIAANETSSHIAYEVTEKTFQRRVTATGAGGAKILDFYLGKTLVGASFVRKVGGKKVYEIAGNLLWEFDPGDMNWIETRLTDFKADQVERLVLKGGKKSVTVVRAKEIKPSPPGVGTLDGGLSFMPPPPAPKPEVSWLIMKPVAGKADPGKLKSLLSSFGSIYFNALVGKKIKPEHGLSQPALTATVHLKGKKQITVLIGAKDQAGNSRYALKKGQNFVVKVGNHVLKDLDKSARELLPGKKKSKP